METKAHKQAAEAARPLLEEYPVEMIQRVCEIFLAKPFTSKPDKIYLPETDEPICMVLSSEKTHYYRTTPTHCTCKGWKYSQQKYGVGLCRHHKLAFKIEAEKNREIIEKIEIESRKPIKKARTPLRAEAK